MINGPTDTTAEYPVGKCRGCADAAMSGITERLANNSGCRGLYHLGSNGRKRYGYKIAAAAVVAAVPAASATEEEARSINNTP